MFVLCEMDSKDKKDKRHNQDKVVVQMKYREQKRIAERSKARVCGRSLAGVADSNPAGGMDVCVVCVVQ